MKFSTFAAAAALALAPTTSAWRIYLYNWKDGNADGGYITNSGPGGTGERCHGTGDMNNKISSIRWYSKNSETNPTSQCDVTFYNSLGCQDRLAGPYTLNFLADASVWDADNKITSYKTRCWAI
ncbi:uncharacterized protein DNG_09147 [Cephalotrichum gorgonifer]|uniref:Uncharacterized protein n=1 Tax=Cephalotrichum gorgonifer TaxID=2041049 RepID=A0AAE8N5B1_9PEZI|nr:uncharacterized protein DNG_09147 [Cephalotrichum gorgonifer]